MKLANWKDGLDSNNIIIEYIGEGGDVTTTYVFNRNSGNNLDTFLAEERDINIFSVVSSMDNLVRLQFDANFQWIGYLNENTSSIAEDCKYILVGNTKNVTIAAKEYINKLLYGF